MATIKPPTAAETRKAFRAAVDAIDLTPEARLVALEVFKSSLGSNPQKRQNRRQIQNQAIRDIQTLGEILPGVLDKCADVIKRNDYSNGSLHHDKGELAPDPKKPWQEDMTGNGPPTWGDPTGEEACWEESLHDPTGKIISAMCTAMGQWRTMAELLQSQTNIDVTLRAKRSMPDCLACGDPCLGRIYGGFDDKCYRRWLRAGRPDRSKFIFEVKDQRSMEMSATDDSGADLRLSNE